MVATLAERAVLAEQLRTMPRCEITGKVCHNDEATAYEHAMMNNSDDGVPMNVYRCTDCGTLHVGRPLGLATEDGTVRTVGGTGEYRVLEGAPRRAPSDPLPGLTAPLTPLDAEIIDLDRRRSAVLVPDEEAVNGLFDHLTSPFTKYRITVRFTNRVAGGIPRDPDIVAGWLRHKAGVTDDEELLEATRQTLRKQGLDVPATATFEQLKAATDTIASERKGNTFYRDSQGLFLETRCLKAGLREAVNILYPYQEGNRWFGKSAKNAFVERVTLAENRAHFGVHQPDGTYLQVGQVTGPAGPRSTLTLYDYLQQPTLTFTVMSLNDCVTADQWLEIWQYIEGASGFGALRSQLFGRMKVVGVERLANAGIDRYQHNPFAVGREDAVQLTRDAHPPSPRKGKTVKAS